MGVNDREQERKDRSKQKREEAVERKRNRRTGGLVADWTGVDGELLKRAIAAIAAMGGATRLGYTRDGGAYSIGIYGDGEPFTEYVPPSDDINEYLQGVLDDYEKG